MMKTQMENSREFRLVQVSSYSGQTVIGFENFWKKLSIDDLKFVFHENEVVIFFTQYNKF